MSSQIKLFETIINDACKAGGGVTPNCIASACGSICGKLYDEHPDLQNKYAKLKEGLDQPIFTKIANDSQITRINTQIAKHIERLTLSPDELFNAAHKMFTIEEYAASKESKGTDQAMLMRTFFSVAWKNHSLKAPETVKYAKPLRHISLIPHQTIMKYTN